MPNPFPYSVRKAVFLRCRQLQQKEDALLETAPIPTVPYPNLLQEMDRHTLS